jgi:hypothetical protein
MDLKLPIVIHDELSETVIKSTGMLDLASGDIFDVKYESYDLEAEGFPAESEEYEFTCGVLSNGKKEVEFRVEVDPMGGKYSITPSELLELKGRAAKLFTARPEGMEEAAPPPKKGRGKAR